MSDPASDPSRLRRFEPAVRFDGGELDCGSGLLLEIRRRIDPLDSVRLLPFFEPQCKKCPVFQGFLSSGRQEGRKTLSP